jgi:hypothetical protein
MAIACPEFCQASPLSIRKPENRVGDGFKILFGVHNDCSWFKSLIADFQMS